MPLEKWSSCAMTRDGVKFMETTMIWDTKQKKIVDKSSKLLLPKEELERRRALIEPLALYRWEGP